MLILERCSHVSKVTHLSLVSLTRFKKVLENNIYNTAH